MHIVGVWIWIWIWSSFLQRWWRKLSKVQGHSPVIPFWIGNSACSLIKIHNFNGIRNRCPLHQTPGLLNLVQEVVSNIGLAQGISLQLKSWCYKRWILVSIVPFIPVYNYIIAKKCKKRERHQPQNRVKIFWSPTVSLEKHPNEEWNVEWISLKNYLKHQPGNCQRIPSTHNGRTFKENQAVHLT